jgi:hypothetical protein
MSFLENAGKVSLLHGECAPSLQSDTEDPLDSIVSLNVVDAPRRRMTIAEHEDDLKSKLKTASLPTSAWKRGQLIGTWCELFSYHCVHVMQLSLSFSYTHLSQHSHDDDH